MSGEMTEVDKINIGREARDIDRVSALVSIKPSKYVNREWSKELFEKSRIDLDFFTPAEFAEPID